MTETAGQKLRARLDAALEERGAGWEWTQYDLEVIESATRHADRAEQLQSVYETELAGERRASSLARLGAEIRHHERRVIELIAVVTAPDEVPKSVRHQAAVNTRWRRKREREAARVVPMHGA
jgi:hypothetical protein